jgi:heme/copper-type cytochrome/quinol oxidase subunit 2
MEQRKKWLIAILVIIIIALIAYIAFATKQKSPTNTKVEVPKVTENQETPAPVANTPEGGTNVGDKFRVEVPKDIKVPEVNDQTLTPEQKKDVAIPTVVAPAAPGVDSKYRSFDIKAEGGLFAPANVIVNQGDTVHINLTAVDRDYDFIIPSFSMKQTAKKGQTRIVEFQASQIGSFVFYCEVCGGATSTAKGNIIIK